MNRDHRVPVRIVWSLCEQIWSIHFCRLYYWHSYRLFWAVYLKLNAAYIVCLKPLARYFSATQSCLPYYTSWKSSQVNLGLRPLLLYQPFQWFDRRCSSISLLHSEPRRHDLLGFLRYRNRRVNRFTYVFCGIESWYCLKTEGLHPLKGGELVGKVV